MPSSNRSEFEHGHGGYTNHGCRCQVCRDGVAAYMRLYREEHREHVNEMQRARRRKRKGLTGPS